MSNQTSEAQTSDGAQTRRGDGAPETASKKPAKYVLLRLFHIGDGAHLMIRPAEIEMEATTPVIPMNARAIYGVIGSVEAHSRAQAWELCKADAEIRERLPKVDPTLDAEPEATGMWLLPASAIAEFEVTPVPGWEVEGL